MARKTGEPLKQNLLLLFVVVCVALVGLTWMEGLSEPQEKTPASSRGVPTAVGPTSAVTLRPTSETKEHKNDEHSVATETPTAMSTVTGTETVTETVTETGTVTPAAATPTPPTATSSPLDTTENH